MICILELEGNQDFVGNVWVNLPRVKSPTLDHIWNVQKIAIILLLYIHIIDYLSSGWAGIFFFLTTSITTSTNNSMACTLCFLHYVKQLYIRWLLAATNTYPNTRPISDSGSCLVSCRVRGKFIWLGLGVKEVRCCWGLEEVTAGSAELRLLMPPVYLHG